MEKTESLTADSWLNAGLVALAEGGPSMLKADVLARRLGVSRGSFYWHFRDVADFQDALLRRWAELAVETPIAMARAETLGRPAEALANLIEQAMSSPIRLEAAVSAWAVQSAPVQRAVRKINRRRIELLTDLLKAIGFQESVAKARARLLCAAYLGRTHLEAEDFGSEEREELIDAFSRQLPITRKNIAAIHPKTSDR
ncbi:MAG: TetR/AcrR family transcriptional regulator [Bryobacterales bacterium]|nr:TetR/AcrR family transcriptional regulator [Hyphomonas sp.]